MRRLPPSLHSAQRPLWVELLLPLLIGLAIIAIIAGLLIQKIVNEELKTHIELEAKLLINTINHAAETITDPAQLQREVAAIGGERNVNLILVAAGDPPRIIAGTHLDWLGMTLDELPNQHYADDLRRGTTRHYEYIDDEDADDVFELARPLYLNTPEIKDGRLTQGVILIYMDTHSIDLALFQTKKALILGATFLIATLTGLTLWLVQARVLTPVNQITKTIRQQATGERQARAPTGNKTELGQLSDTLNTMLDIQEQSERELETSLCALAQSEETQRLILDATQDALWDWSVPSGQVEYSPAWSTILGYDPEEITADYHFWAERVHPEDYPQVMKQISEHLENRTDYFNCEYRLICKNGDWKWIQSRGRVVKRDDKGNALRMVGSTTDIDARKRAEAAMKEASDAALKTARFKSQFLANMSHEIRTPMNGLIGMLDLLKETSLTEEQACFIDTAYESSETLLHLLNDILDLTKAESGKLTLETMDFDLRSVANNVIHLMLSKANSKGLNLYCKIDPKLPELVKGDPTRISQILTNLIDNAIKFTDHGEIGLELSTLATTPGTKEVAVQFKVRDTGIGIPEESLKSIFEPFVQADGSITRRYGGTGLGLAISKQLVESMNGELEAVPLPEGGSVFSFALCM